MLPLLLMFFQFLLEYYQVALFLCSTLLFRQFAATLFRQGINLAVERHSLCYGSYDYSPWIILFLALSVPLNALQNHSPAEWGHCHSS